MLKLLIFITALVAATGLLADTAKDLAAANQALANSEFTQAASGYRALLASDPENGQLHYGLGTALMGLGQLDAAAKHFSQAGELGFRPQGVGYRMARIRAQQGDANGAIEKLQEIADAGFPAPSLIENEADFVNLRDAPGYLTALAKIQENRFPCKNRAVSRAFDFWKGSWHVTSQGQVAGENRIEAILGDCVLLENWTNVAGQSGKSFNFYDAGEKHWRQIWVDDTGGVLDFTGQITNGEMHYHAVTHDPSTGAETLHRMTFTPNDDGSVRQLMEQSTDQGENWQVAFDGHYAPVDSELESAAVDQ